MTTSRTSIGAAVRAARESAGLTLKDLSARTSIAVNTLNRTELGERDVSFSELSAIASAVNIDLSDIILLAKNCEKTEVSNVMNEISSLEKKLLILQKSLVQEAISLRSQSVD